MTVRAQTVTILFTDLVSSTELLQRAGDERAQRIFKAHHRLLSDAVQAHDGHEVKWLGDGLMVAFDSARDAAKCAVAMQQASRRPAAGERLEIRVGLHVGDAFVDESDYFGTSVVIARRLCDKADAGQIYASDMVVRLLDGRHEIAFDDLGTLALKGIDTPVHAHEVRYEHDPLTMLAVTPFVGREDVLATLTSRLEDARRGKGSLVMLVGEPGIGKTRTAEEFADHARQAGALVLSGRCYDGEWAAPFSPFMEAIKEYAAAAPPEELAQRLGADAGVLARIVPALRERLPDIAEPPVIPAEGERYRLLESAGDFFAHLAEARPVVLMLDDLHWADKGTIAMLRQVARTASQRPLLLVGAYRDIELDRTHPLADALQALRRETNYERIVLKGLEASVVGELLSLVAERQVPEQFVTAIGDETGGNPFFIREVMLHLVEEKKIVQEDGRWVGASSVADMRIPEGVREVIGRRLSRLSHGCNRMLTVASALTAGFSWDVISALVDTGDAPLLDAVDEALAAQLIVEREKGSYDFTHALIRHTLYEELNTPRRILLHRQIGEALERLYAGDIEAHLAELAHHFYQTSSSGDAARAIEYCTRAGNRAVDSIAFDEAVLHYQRSVELQGDDNPDLRADLLLALGRAEYKAGQFTKSRRTFELAGDAARLANNPELFARAAVQEFRIWGDDDPDLCAFVEEALGRLPEGESALRARVMGCVAWRESLNVSSDVRDQLFETAIGMARKYDDGFTLPYVLKWWHWGHRRDPDVPRRLKVGAEFYDLASRSEDPVLRLMAPHSRIYDALALGDVAETENQIRDFCRLADEFKIEQYRSLGVQYWVMLGLLRGEHSEIESLLTERETDNETGAQGQKAISLFFLRRDQGRTAELLEAWSTFAEDEGFIGTWVRAGLATTYFDSDRESEARAMVERCTPNALKTLGPDRVLLAAAITDVVAVYGEVDQQVAFFEALLPHRGYNTVLGQGALSVGSVDRYLGLLADAMGRTEESCRYFEVALAMNARMGARPWLARTQLDYARVLLRRAGDGARARELADAALATARDIGMVKVAADCEAVLA